MSMSWADIQMGCHGIPPPSVLPQKHEEAIQEKAFPCREPRERQLRLPVKPFRSNTHRRKSSLAKGELGTPTLPQHLDESVVLISNLPSEQKFFYEKTHPAAKSRHHIDNNYCLPKSLEGTIVLLWVACYSDVS
jgi:hypothetical protein